MTNEVKRIEAMTWLADRDILWLPVLIKIGDDGKKKFLDFEARNILGYTPKFDDFGKLREHVIRRRMSDFKTHFDNYHHYAQEEDQDAYWVLGIDTRRVAILDVDDPSVLPLVQPLLQDHPYYLSTSKRLPKIFVLDEEMRLDARNNLKFLGGSLELQKGQWSYIDPDEPIFNPNGTFHTSLSTFLPKTECDEQRPITSTSTSTSTSIGAEDFHFFKDHETFKRRKRRNPPALVYPPPSFTAEP